MAKERKETAPLTLAGDFPAATDEAWRGLVRRILSGHDPEETLVRRTYDGIAVQPLYTAQDRPADDAAGFPGMAPFTRGHRVAGSARAGWDIRQLHAHPDPARCNEAIREDLAHGVTSIELRFDRAGRGGSDADDATHSGVDGIMIAGIDDLDAALAGVHLDACPVGLRSGAAFLPASAMLLGLVGRRGIVPEAFAGALNADPIGALAAEGRLTTSLPEALEQFGWLARYVAEGFPATVAASVDTTCYHDAGASEAQELACAAATGVAYLRAMTEVGLDTDAAFAQIAFTFAADANLFLSIVKLRSARRLWGRIAEACGAPSAVRGMRLHAVTSGRMLARRDPWVNILRGTVAALAAAVAGADSITVLPYTAAIGIPDAAARRIARNTQLVLQQESSLARVIDPAGGSWAMESLTDAMAGEAWALFQEIEREGGIAASLMSGGLQARIAAVAGRRAGRIAALADPLTGTSAFPDLSEPPVTVQRADLKKLRARAAEQRRKRGAGMEAAVGGLARAQGQALAGSMIAHACAGASIGALARASAHAAPAEAAPLPRRRLGEEFEALRDLSDAHLEKTGRRPTVYLATIGSPAQYMAAETYARNFLAAGGIEAVSANGPNDASPAAGLHASGAAVAVICSDGAGYRERGAEVTAALAGAGARKIYLTGAPAAGDGPQRPEVSGYLHDGCDVLAALRGILQTMGIWKQ
jgi:methylmalonyl-CoA mutase